MNNPLLAIQSQYWAVRDYLSPVLRESKFKEHGRITPDEFVAAGDFLAYKFPVWAWDKGEAGRARDFLPADKQYLITRNVPCLRRANAVAYTDADEDAERLLNFMDDAEEAPGPDGERRRTGGEDDWVETHVGRASALHAAPGEIADIPDLDEPGPSMRGLSLADEAKPAPVQAGGAETDDLPDMDDIPDMDDEGAGLEEEEDVAGAQARVDRTTETASSNLLQVRTYDCMITYDKHYQTPRFWLLGYDENKRPLTPTEVFQDVPSDHAFKTMTMETFPHSGQLLASVHPCKHASVMKKFIDRMDDAQRAAGAGGGAAAAAAGGAKTDETKRKWGIGKMVRKVTGGVQSQSQGQGAAAAPSAAGTKTAEGEAAEDNGLQVDFYLVIFLKFIASIVPTIEVDTTTAF